MDLQGIPNMDYGNYSQYLPDAAKFGLQGLYAGAQAQEIQNRQAQNQLALNLGNMFQQQQSLNTNVANAQNNPENIAQIVAGKMGEAQSNQAAGAQAMATLPGNIAATNMGNKVKVSQGDIALQQNKLEKALIEMTTNGPMGVNAISDPDIKQAVITGSKASGKNPVDFLKGIHDQLNQELSQTPEQFGKMQVENRKAESAAEVERMRAAASNYNADKVYDWRTQNNEQTNIARLNIQQMKNDAELGKIQGNTQARKARALQQAGAAHQSAISRWTGNQVMLEQAQKQYQADVQQIEQAYGSAGSPKPSLTPEQRQAIIDRLTGGK